MDPRRRTVTGDGLDLAAWEWGDEHHPTVVLVHGYPDTHRVWGGVAADLAADHHVVAYDVRGAGESGTPAGRAGYDLAHLEADLAAVVAATSPDRPVHLVGHDWGSIQAWEAVTGERLRGRIASFTSISGPCLDHAARWSRERRTLRRGALTELVKQGRRSWYVAMFQVPGLADAAWRTFVPRAFPRYLHRVEGVRHDHAPAPTLSSDGRNGLELYRRNVPRKMSDPDERTTDVPVLLVVPTGDRYVTPALLDDVGRWVSDLRRIDIDGGHWIVLTEPERIADLVRRHVADVEAR